MSTEVANHIEKLQSTSVDERLQAAEALCQLGEPPAEATVALVRATGDADERVREAAAAAVEGVESPASSQTAPLASVLRDGSGDVAYWAATLLGRIGTDAQAAAQTLADVLADSTREQHVRERCAWALGKIGPAAHVALPALRTAADNAQGRLQRLARAAIDAIEQ